MDVSIGPDQELLVDTAARLAAEVATTTTAGLRSPDRSAPAGHARAADDAADARGWQLLVDTGFVGLHLPEALGGAGGTGVDVALVAEQIGKAVSTVPFLGQAVLAPELLRAGGASERDLAPVLSGDERVTIALDPTLRRVARAGETAVAFDARGARTALAIGQDGSVVTVDLDGAPSCRSADLTRDLRSVEVPRDASPVGPAVGDKELVVFEALALSVVAADLVGVMEASLDAAVDYVRERVQFGVPVGTFQAVQHLAADAKVALEASRGSMWHAAWAVDALDPDDALLAARQAKAWCAPAARLVTETMVQLLGGIAITWEELAHVRVRRALLDRLCFGDEGVQLDAIASARLGGDD
jgi:alkylation response protein AidB-like acyl-CoA dehydrogenase